MQTRRQKTADLSGAIWGLWLILQIFNLLWATIYANAAAGNIDWHYVHRTLVAISILTELPVISNDQLLDLPITGLPCHWYQSDCEFYATARQR